MNWIPVISHSFLISVTVSPVLLAQPRKEKDFVCIMRKDILSNINNPKLEVLGKWCREKIVRKVLVFFSWGSHHVYNNFEIYMQGS